MFADEVRECMKDVGWQDVPTHDAILFIANGIKSPKVAKACLKMGIDAKTAGDMYADGELDNVPDVVNS